MALEGIKYGFVPLEKSMALEGITDCPSQFADTFLLVWNFSFGQVKNRTLCT